ncbi:DUF4249 domain-containing protein [Arundinibacter roseus]|nr:DUF4249 domain-containing protein [Arundinibacter roseus]
MPPEIVRAESFLVVDGFLNVKPLTNSQFKLSRTQTIYDKKLPDLEQEALVRIEGDKGSVFDCIESHPGVYTLGPNTYAENEKFRLRIQLQDGKAYVSEYVPAMQTPPIDSVTYQVNPDNSDVQFYVSTHDPQNKTRFYRWSFEETWEYQMPLFSNYDIRDKQIVLRTEGVNRCWDTRKSGRITVGSSVRLSEDKIQEMPITYVPVGSEKLRYKYSILVKQFGVSPEEFEYWNNLSQTNELTGGLFDAQPTEVTGNISCISNPGEPVFGFFSATSLEEKRLFVTEGLGVLNYLDSTCEPLDTLPASEAIRMNEELSHLILVEFFVPGSPELWFTMGSPACSDCRELGGTTKKPPFWE